MTTTTTTDAVQRLSSDVGERLTQFFDQTFSLWIFCDAEWQATRQNCQDTVTDCDIPNEPVARRINGNQYALDIPFPYEDHQFFARATFTTGEPGLLRRLASCFVQDLEHQKQAARMESDIESFAVQITRDFEELTFLRELADCLRISTGSEDFQQVAEILLPRVILSIEAKQVLLVCDQRRDESAMDGPRSPRMVSVGHDIADQALAQRLLDRFGTDASDHPVLRNGICDSFLPGIREVILLKIRNPGSQERWLIAINRDTEFVSGLMNPNRHSHSEFGTEEVSLLNSASTVLATYASNLDLLAEKEKLLVNVVRSLVTAVEAKDDYTCGHSERVALYARRLAEHLGMDFEECHRVYLTGLLHDIGKIGVPDSALKKPGKLTDAEFELIKQHPEAGGAILNDLDPLQYVMPGILHHHERFDGKGYPAKLSGDEIPMVARILAVADTFDAMTSDRPYRQGMPVEKAIQLLKEGRDEQWHGEIVDAFIDVLPEILKIRDSYRQLEKMRDLHSLPAAPSVPEANNAVMPP